MWDEPVPLFPDWLLAEDILRHFTVTDDRPDVTMVTLSYHLRVTELERLRSLADPRVPLIVFYTLDDFDEPSRGGWDRPREWSAAIRRLTGAADLLVGAQLPVSLPADRCLAFPFAPVIPFASASTSPAIDNATTDLYFSGAWYPIEEGGEAPEDTRDRQYRAYLVERLRSRLPERHLDFRRVHFWRTNPLDPGGPRPDEDPKARLLAEHTAALDRTRIGFAPTGYGYLTTRHFDTLARGRVLLTEEVHHRLHVPEPERWADFALFYHPEQDDIADVVAKALADPQDLRARAEAGHQYARQYLHPRRQVERLASAVRRLIGPFGGRQ